MLISSEILRVVGPLLVLALVVAILISLVVFHLRTRGPRTEDQR